MRPVLAIGMWLMASLAWPQAPITLTHVHGLAYRADGERLMIPSHHGLAVYQNGKWSKAPGPQHEYTRGRHSRHQASGMMATIRVA